MGNVNEKSDEDNHHNGKNNNNLAKDEPKEIKKEIELVIANKVDQLPVKIQEKLNRTDIMTEKLNDNFEILLNILNFENGRRYKFMTKDQYDLKKNSRSGGSNNELSSPRKDHKNANNLKIDFFSRKSVNLKADMNHKKVPDSTNSLREDLSQIMEEAEKIVEVVQDEQELKKRYKVMKKKGDGGFGEVFSAKDSQVGKKVAIKKMEHYSDKHKKMNLCEVYFLKKCQNDNVVEFKRAHVINNLSEMWVVMEYLEGGTLTDAVKDGYTFTETQVAYAARELLRGIQFLHSVEICHRDIKSSNVMMSTSGEIKLIDFGLCCSMKDGPKTHYLGSPFWIPPEMIQKQPHSYPVDIWSFAICVMELCDGEPPNRKSSVRAMFLVGIGEPPKLKSEKNYSKSIHDFLEKCLVIDPAKRWSAKQLLNHDFCAKAETKNQMKEVLQQIFLKISLQGL